jgi:threonyl-tRNA synthetase
VGDKEMKTKKLPARVRGLEKLKPFSAKALTAEIRKKTEGMPFRPLAMPKLLSMRPIFVGSS